MSKPPFPRARLARPLAVLALLAAAPVPLAAQQIDWVHEIESLAPGNEGIRGVAPAGDVYVVGYTTGDLAGQPAAGSTSVFLRRYDPAGAEVWTVQFGAGHEYSASAIAADASALYFVGYRRVSTGTDVLVRRYDLDGVLSWERQFGVGTWAFGQDVAVDAGGVYVVGTVHGALPGQTFEGVADGFVRRYAHDGTELWTRQFGTAEDEGSRMSVAVSAAGVFVGGTTRGTFPGETRYGASTAFPDAYVRSYDAAGALQWTRQLGTSFWGAHFGDLAADAAGVWVCGATAGAFPGHVSAGRADAWLRRYDALGQEVWTRQYGTPESDSATSVAADAAGALVAGHLGEVPGQAVPSSYVRRYEAAGALQWTRQDGTFRGGIEVAVDATSIWLGGAVGETVLGRIESDARFERRDLAGELLWARTIATQAVGSDLAQAADSDGCLYVGGSVHGTLDGQETSGQQDAYVRKLDAAGQEVWTRQLGSPRRDSVEGLAVDASGLYAAGTTEGELAGQATSGGWDAFVVALHPEGGDRWTLQYGSAGSDEASAAATSAAGVFVAGTTWGAFPGAVAQGGLDAFLSRLDDAGSLLWTRQLGTSAHDLVFAVAATATEVAVAGYTWGAFPGFASQGGVDAWLRVYDVGGALQWTAQLGTAGTDSFEGLAIHDGLLYAAGRSPLLGGAGVVRAYDLDGTLRWEAAHDGAIYGATVDAAGVFVCGDASGLPGQTPLGGGDAFVGRLDHAGGELWSLLFGTDRNDRARAVTRSSAGLFVAGTTFGAFDGGPHVPNDVNGFAARVTPFDTDEDGLPDVDEVAIGTDPLDPDTDDDGLLDGTEVDVAAGSGCPDPLVADSDGDGLGDGAEVALGTSPCASDTDGDGLPDDIDPDPLTPAVTAGVLHEAVLALCAEIEVLDLALFNGPNGNVNAARRNALAASCRGAASSIGDGHLAGAAASLAHVLERVDGLAPPADWLVPSPEKTALAEDLAIVIALLST